MIWGWEPKEGLYLLGIMKGRPATKSLLIARNGHHLCLCLFSLDPHVSCLQNTVLEDHLVRGPLGSFKYLGATLALELGL